MDIRREAQLEIDAARVIKAQIAELTDDDDAIRDTLEGETDLAGIVRKLIISITDDEALCDSAKAVAETYRARASRFDLRADAKRALLLKTMDMAEWRSKEFDVGTVSLARLPPSCIVFNEDVLPDEFWKAAKPSIDKTAVLKALKSGADVPGAEMKNGGYTLKISKA